MGMRVAGVAVARSGLGWWAYSPRSRLRLPVGRLSRRAAGATREALEPVFDHGRELLPAEPPRPVAPLPTRHVHPRLTAKTEHVLEWIDRRVGR